MTTTAREPADAEESSPHSLALAGLAASSEPSHRVQFYEHDEQLYPVVSDYVQVGLAARQTVLVIATLRHWAAVSGSLRAMGVDVERASASGQLIIRDANQLLELSPPNGASAGAGAGIDVEVLRELVAPAGERANAQSGGQLRVYAEIVDLFWQNGQRRAALRLEAHWQELQRELRFALLCAYHSAPFHAQPQDIHDVCGMHGQVAASSPERPQIAFATTAGAQHARLLIAEIGRRKELEQSLRRSLAELQGSHAHVHEHQHEREHLERARISRATAEQAAERLVTITAAIADAVTAEQVYEAIVDRAAAALGATTAVLWVLGADEIARPARAYGHAPAALQNFDILPLTAASDSPALDAMQQRGAIWLDSAAALFERYPAFADGLAARGARCLGCLPLLVHERRLGALMFTFDEAIDPDRHAFLAMVARHSAQALERLRLLEAEQHSRALAQASAARAELLYQLAAALIAAERIEDVFEPALAAIAAALGAERSAILAFDRDDVMRFKAWRGLSDEYRRAVEGHSPWPRDARDPEPLAIPDVACDASLSGFLPLFHREGIGALAFIPLSAGGRLLGKFMVYYASPRRLAPDELSLATAIANHCAVALAHFAMLNELQTSVHFNEMFTGMLGHDLRTPLSAITTAAQLLRELDESGRSARPLARILSSGARMARMIDQLLDFTRVRVGTNLRLELASCDLLRALTQVVDELDPAQSNARSPIFRIEHDGDVTGSWDADRLLQVFSNLLANALQHGTLEHGVSIRVDGTERECVQISVHNMGAIPASLLPRVFEPLTGGERRRDRSRGLGLGLYISREIVNAHRGTIAVQSSDVAGTTFVVTLPRASAQRP
jgi:signal transduction histidine kinase